MSARIFLRDIAGLKAGDIREYEWTAFEGSLRQHHGVSEPLDTYTMDIEEAARRYVLSVTPKVDGAGRGRTRASGDAAA